MLEDGSTLTVGSHAVTVVRYISEGGFSKIYEVIMDPPEADGEIGCLKQVIVPDKNGLTILRKEVDVMKTLRNARSIVRYYDSHAERLPDGRYQVLVLMELCPNNSLLHYMNERIREKLTEKQILKIMLDISIGVYEMHLLKLIHRDIKIENVLIDSHENFKLCDFGSVSSPLGPATTQQEFQILSHDILYHTTPQYRAPEMIDLTRRLPIAENCDIWALGCFLYKLCYYITPFETNGEMAILHATYQFPTNREYSGDMKNLIVIMLQENPAYRPNIIQIIMLLAKMTKVDFETLAIEDFYKVGPYNFQGLHDMQRQKHEEFLRQQYYYEQKRLQALQASAEPGGPRPESISSSKTPESSLVSKTSVSKQGSRTSDVTQTSKSPSTLPLLDPAPELYDVPGVPDADGAAKESEDLDHDISELDFLALDEAEARYPSLENLEHDSSTSTADILAPVKSATSSKSIVVSPNVDAINEDNSPVQNITLPKRTGPDLESAAAWKTPKPKVLDERLDKLVDEIFDNSPVDLKKSARVALALQMLSAEPKENGVQAQLPREIQLEPAKPLTSLPQQAPPVPLELAERYNDGNLDPAAAALAPSPRVTEAQKVIPKRDLSNPWVNAMEQSPRSNNVYAKESVWVPAPMQDFDISAGEAELNVKPAPYLPAEVNLIDLDSAMKPLQDTMRRVPETKLGRSLNHLKVEAAINEYSLIDLDHLEQAKPVDLKAFKKRVPEQQLQPLSFKEEVIDFASDDENVNSEMSRLAIRNSLKKTRRLNEHKRS